MRKILYANQRFCRHAFTALAGFCETSHDFFCENHRDWRLYSVCVCICKSLHFSLLESSCTNKPPSSHVCTWGIPLLNAMLCLKTPPFTQPKSAGLIVSTPFQLLAHTLQTSTPSGPFTLTFHHQRPRSLSDSRRNGKC